MIAVSPDGYPNQKVHPVIPSMLEIKDNAEWYSIVSERVVLYYPATNDEWVYVIEGKKYNALGTNTLEYFENKEVEDLEIQMKLF